MDKVIVFCVDWFHPAIQAGGPINSVMKIGQLLAEKAKVYIITSNTDLDGSLLDVETGNWTDYSKNTWVCYLDRSQQRGICLDTFDIFFNPGMLQQTQKMFSECFLMR